MPNGLGWGCRTVLVAVPLLLLAVVAAWAGALVLGRAGWHLTALLWRAHANLHNEIIRAK